MFGKDALPLPRVQFLHLLTIPDWLRLQRRTLNAAAGLQARSCLFLLGWVPDVGEKGRGGSGARIGENWRAKPT